MKLSEKQTQKQITDYLTALNIPCWRQNMGVKDSRINKLRRQEPCFYRFLYWLFPLYPKKTFLDLAGVNPKTGQFFTIEVKAEGKKPTDAQKNTIAFFLDCSCPADWFDSFEDAKKFIDKHLR